MKLEDENNQRLRRSNNDHHGSKEEAIKGTSTLNPPHTHMCANTYTHTYPRPSSAHKASIYVRTHIRTYDLAILLRNTVSVEHVTGSEHTDITLGSGQSHDPCLVRPLKVCAGMDDQLWVRMDEMVTCCQEQHSGTGDRL